MKISFIAVIFAALYVYGFANGTDTSNRPPLCRLPIDRGTSNCTKDLDIEIFSSNESGQLWCGDQAALKASNMAKEYYQRDKKTNEYGFDTINNECVRFTYSGCGGNDNRFKTFADCRRTCD